MVLLTNFANANNPYTTLKRTCPEINQMDLKTSLLLQVLPDLLVGDLPVGLGDVDGLLDGHGPLPGEDLVEHVVVALLEDVADDVLGSLLLQLEQHPVVGVVDDREENVLSSFLY